MDDRTGLYVGGLFALVYGLILYRGLQDGRIAYGWFFFKPLTVERAAHPFFFWLVVLFHVVLLGLAAAWIGQSLLLIL